MTENTIRSGQTPDPNKDYGFTDEVIDLEVWPDLAESDEREYGIRWTQNVRAVMADNGTSADQPVIDTTTEDGFEFVPIDHKRTEPTRTMLDGIAERRGSYTEMAQIAVMLNKRQDQFETTGRPFNFYPHELSTALA